jgi:hypothetical protein
MLQKEKMRRADVFTGAAVFLFGAWIVSQAFKMPMKDSWGGVMNVWYVSPALLPLFVGSMLMLLGAMLCHFALKTIGLSEFRKTVRWLLSPEHVRVLTSDATVRFYAIVVLFLTLVFVNLPRVDFFLCAFLFLIPFITMFFFYDDVILKRLLFFYLAGEMGLIFCFLLGVGKPGDGSLALAPDILVLCLIVGYCLYTWRLIHRVPEYRKKYRTSLLVGLVVPLIVGPVFKYLLMVPLPKEGLVVALIDVIRYLDY